MNMTLKHNLVDTINEFHTKGCLPDPGVCKHYLRFFCEGQTMMNVVEYFI